MITEQMKQKAGEIVNEWNEGAEIQLGVNGELELIDAIAQGLNTAHDAGLREAAEIAKPGVCCCNPNRSKFIKHFSNCAQYIASAIEARIAAPPEEDEKQNSG